jgi:hypothetical protein
MRHRQLGFAVLLTKHPRGKCPRFADLLKSRVVLIRSRESCRRWLRTMQHEGIEGRVVKVEIKDTSPPLRASAARRGRRGAGGKR